LKSAIESIKDKKESIRAKAFLKETISLASTRIFEKSVMDNNKDGMGTTLVCVYVSGGTAYIAQVGDSRVYLYRDGVLWRITEDHSYINEQLRAGLITKEQANLSTYKNVITRSVGFDEVVESDIYVRDLKSRDIFLLCSDGLTSMISNEDICNSIDADNLENSVSELIDKANEAGGHDNISVVLVKIG
jgi:protein phosphatase